MTRLLYPNAETARLMTSTTLETLATHTVPTVLSTGVPLQYTRRTDPMRCEKGSGSKEEFNT